MTRADPGACPFEDDPGQPGLPDRLDTQCFLLTSARARVANTGLYAQQAVDLFEGRLHVEGGLRYDYFRFNVEDRISPAFSGARGEGQDLARVASMGRALAHRGPEDSSSGLTVRTRPAVFN